MQQDRPFVSLEAVDDGSVEVRTAVVFTQRSGPGAQARVVQATFPVTDRLGRMINSVETSYQEYQELVFFREDLKALLTLTLAFVLLLSLLAAIYGAFVLSRRLVAPIQDLVAGTRAVAMGNFDTRLPTPSRDEIGFLISSFNDMTQRLATARREASLSQALVEAERTNLEVILARLSTGVLALESDLTIRTANQASSSILGVDLGSRSGEPLREVAGENALLGQFVDVACVHLDAGETEWREQVVLRGEVGRRVLTCACTTLPGDEHRAAGYVIVFDDPSFNSAVTGPSKTRAIEESSSAPVVTSRLPVTTFPVSLANKASWGTPISGTSSTIVTVNRALPSSVYVSPS